MRKGRKGQVAMVDTSQTGKPIDFSIMPSFQCNLQCWFCMYECGPDNHTTLSLRITRSFLQTVDWLQINTMGFYGGEPSINMPLYDKFVKLVPVGVPKFIITNGAWSLYSESTSVFLHWCARHQFHVHVSSTTEHVRYQNRDRIKNICALSPGVTLKTPDEIHSQGRAKGHLGASTDCELSCTRRDRNIRLGLKPNGDIVFQNCHGEYHVIQTYNEPFTGILERTLKVKNTCLKKEKEGRSLK